MVSTHLLLLSEKVVDKSKSGSFILSLSVKFVNLSVGAESLHGEIDRLQILEWMSNSVPLGAPILRIFHSLDDVEVASSYVIETTNASPERSHILFVDDLFDTNSLLAVKDLLADEELLEVLQTLLLDEGISGSLGEDDLVVVWAVGENFLGGGDGGRCFEQ